VRNALCADTWRGLSDALEACAANPQVRAIVLHGAGTAFSAGGDLTTMEAEQGDGHGPAERLALAQSTIMQLARTTKTTIAAVEGPAIGVGWSIALATDMAVAGVSAFFAAPQLRLGLVPDGGIGWLLSRSIGLHRAREVMLRGRRLTATEAHALGLVVEVVEDGGAMRCATDLARSMLDVVPSILDVAKQQVLEAHSRTLADHMERELADASRLGIRSPSRSQQV
jgi:2-(1,2-epoxy-1,2-dihydrophenyl)acetyl-CoA isomerase